MQVPNNSHIAKLVVALNYSQVELYSRIVLLKYPQSIEAHLAIAWAAMKVEFYSAAKIHFATVHKLAAEKQIALEETAAALSIPLLDVDLLRQLPITKSHPLSENTIPSAPQYLLIKAWGYGFWSDVLHVLGGLMLAEMTDRTPVIHWGSNSLYHVSEEVNSFELFFEPVGAPMSSLLGSGLSCFPPKWNDQNLMQENHQKSSGEWSKISALMLLPRKETICVMDYYIGVLNLMPYIPQDSPMAGLTIDEVYQYLMAKYLKVKPHLITQADEFYHQNLSKKSYLGIHVRGSDKVSEFKVVDQLHSTYQKLIEEYLSQLPADSNIFLMTDDKRLLDAYQQQFQHRMVTTDCMRTNSRIGVHYQANENIISSANEVIVDTLVAARAQYFIGNGYSNPSIFVRFLGRWDEGQIHLIGGNRMHYHNTHLYKTIDVN